MTREEWLACQHPAKMVTFLAESGLFSDRKMRLLAATVGRRAWSLLNERERLAIDTAERFADGQADLEALRSVFGADADDYDWLGGVTDVAYAVVLPPSRLGIPALTRVLWCVASAVAEARHPDADFDHDAYLHAAEVRAAEYAAQASLLRCLFGCPPFVPVVIEAHWRTPTVLALARDAQSDFTMRGVLADALADAGCDQEEWLAHLREEGPHGRGCFVVDAVLGTG